MYLPGQIRVGPNWDPFGESREDLSQDWWRALAHEYGHYLLYLPDNYLGLDKDDFLTKTDCRYSFMTTAYDPAYGKFENFAGTAPGEWPGQCKDSLAAKLTGRSDWETITKFYPEMSAPGTKPAPKILPLDLTQVSVMPVEGEASTLPARNFDLRGRDGERQVASQGRAYLFKTKGTPDIEDDGIISLGATGKKDFIKVRGAEPGDQVCVFDTVSQKARMGCQVVGPASTVDLPVRCPRLAAEHRDQAFLPAHHADYRNLVRRK